DPYNHQDPNKQPADNFEADALARFLQTANGANPASKVRNPRDKTPTFADGTPTWEQRITNDKTEFQYIQAVLFKPGCLMACHGEDGTYIDNHIQRPAPDGQHWELTKPGDLAGAVIVNLPMKQTYIAINSNRAMLITAAMVTAILAMV